MDLGYSLLLPVKNGDKYIQRIIENILPFLDNCKEFIIIDDNSSDRTVEIAQSIVFGMPNVRLVSNEGFGLVQALNFGVKLAKYDWIARVDVDDIYELDYLTYQHIVANDNVGAIFTDYSIEGSSLIFPIKIPNALFHFPISLSLLSNRRTPHPSAVINRKIFLDVGGYRTGAHPAEDLDLWFRLSQVSDLLGIDKLALHYQRNSESVTQRNRTDVFIKHSSIISNNLNSDSLYRAFTEVFTNLDAYMQSYGKFYNPNGRRFFLLFDLFKANSFLKIGLAKNICSKTVRIVLKYPGLISFGLVFSCKFVVNRTHEKFLGFRTASNI
jgi:glycosyltransferase involved in cell wall biosynthesis